METEFAVKLTNQVGEARESTQERTRSPLRFLILASSLIPIS